MVLTPLQQARIAEQPRPAVTAAVAPAAAAPSIDDSQFVDDEAALASLVEAERALAEARHAAQKAEQPGAVTPAVAPAAAAPSIDDSQFVDDEAALASLAEAEGALAEGDEVMEQQTAAGERSDSQQSMELSQTDDEPDSQQSMDLSQTDEAEDEVAADLMASPTRQSAYNCDSERAGVYVLRLKKKRGGGDCFYVGKSDDKKRRIAQHASGGAHCAAWVKHNGGVEAVLSPITEKEELSSWEMKETIRLIILHGFANVRGWEWTSCAPFKRSDYEAFKMTAFGMGDLCRKCGNGGHFATRCPGGEKAVWLAECDDAIAAVEATDLAAAASAAAAHPVDNAAAIAAAVQQSNARRASASAPSKRRAASPPDTRECPAHRRAKSSENGARELYFRSPCGHTVRAAPVLQIGGVKEGMWQVRVKGPQVNGVSGVKILYSGPSTREALAEVGSCLGVAPSSFRATTAADFDEDVAAVAHSARGARAAPSRQRARSARRLCEGCDVDISGQPPSHTVCLDCYRIRSNHSSAPVACDSLGASDFGDEEQDAGRVCRRCGDDIDDRPANHRFCSACFAAGSSSSEEEEWVCSYCGRGFGTERGAAFHEQRHCKYRL